MASTKLVCIKQKSPTLPTSTQRGTQGFDKAGGVFYAAEMAKSKIKSGTARRQCRSLQRP